MKRALTILGASCWIVIVGCATADPSRSRVDPNRITRAEIVEVDVADLYEVVQRLRPRWLEVRGSRSFGGETEVVVYQGQSFLGGPEVLRQFDPAAAESLRYLDGPTASASLPGLGSRHVEGAIIIVTSGGR